MSLQLHRPDGKGGVETHGGEGDWRGQLRSTRWGSGLKGRRLPKLANPEMNPTSTALAAAFWVSLAALTFVLLLLGYGTGFWK